MRPKTLYDLCFACPDGTIGVVAGFNTAEFNCKTDKDVEFVYRHAGRMGYSCIRTRNSNQIFVTL